MSLPIVWVMKAANLKSSSTSSKNMLNMLLNDKNSEKADMDDIVWYLRRNEDPEYENYILSW